jgi:hypothetical protein
VLKPPCVPDSGRGRNFLIDSSCDSNNTDALFIIAFPPVIPDLLHLSRSIFGHIPQEVVRKWYEAFTYDTWELTQRLLTL